MDTVIAGTGAVTQINENFVAVQPASTYGRKAPTTTGLTWGYYGGRGFGNTIADGTVTLTASTTNYIVANRSTGAVSTSTLTTNWNDSTNYYRLYQVVTGASTVSSYTDYREFIGGGGSGGASDFIDLGDVPSAYTGEGGKFVKVKATEDGLEFVSGGTADAGDITYDPSTSGLSATDVQTAIDELAAGGGGGSGTVTSVAASGGVETTSGSPITTSGTIRGAVATNAQTGTSYTVVTGDRGKLQTFSNAVAVAVTLPQATSTFGAGWYTFFKNLGAGTVTITPTTSTIGGAASLTLTTGQFAMVVSDGTNYNTVFTAAGGGGGLTNWTEAVNTSSPNASVPVVSFTATNAATNVDAVVSPKGTGSLAAQVADNTTTGGSKRGAQAVDLQMARSSNSQVASGAVAVIGGGSGNTASGTVSFVGGGAGNAATSSWSTVVGGSSGQATGQYSFVGGGKNNVSSSSYSTIVGGNANAASANFAAVGGGSTNTAGGAYSAIFGGYQATTRSIQGTWAFASGAFGTLGDAQEQHAVQRKTTTDATPAGMSADGSVPTATTALVLPNNSAYCFEATVVAKVGTFGDRASFKLTGMVSRGANASATQIDGTPTVTTVAAIGGASAWSVAAVANTTLGSLAIQVTGAASTTIKWVAEIKTIQVVD